MRSASTPLGGEFSASSGVLAENSGHSGSGDRVTSLFHVKMRKMATLFSVCVSTRHMWRHYCEPKRWCYYHCVLKSVHGTDSTSDDDVLLTSSAELVSCSLSRMETKNHRYLFFAHLLITTQNGIHAFGLIRGLLKNTSDNNIHAAQQFR